MDAISAAAARISQGIASPSSLRPSTAAGGIDPTGFGETLKRFVNDVSGSRDQANDVLGQFLRGEPVELHQVMAAQEEANISLEMLVETRNKMLDAYRQLTSIQN